jgi:GT2 family glycosyltransferase
MAGRVSLVLVVFNRLSLTRACLDSLRPTTAPFDLVVVDNGSTDGTEEFFQKFPYPFPLRYHRNAENLGLIRALNQGWRLADREFVCFLHNDTEMREPTWLDRLIGAADRDRSVGLAGLYGVRRLRKDGRYVGRTIVHCLAERPTISGPSVEVAAVDGVCLFLRREMLDAVGGFDEGYGFFHGYDRDLSLKVRDAGKRCVVVSAPFVHRGGGTRTSSEAPVPLQDDLVQRRAALARFAWRWGHRLPLDVRGVGERLADWFRPRDQRPRTEKMGTRGEP